jgi:hypothetical protein
MVVVVAWVLGLGFGFVVVRSVALLQSQAVHCNMLHAT